MKRAIIAAAATLIVGAAPVLAADISPAVVFDMGGKFDKSFNQGVYDGVEKFTKETGIKYREFEVTNETQREQALRRMAQRSADPVIGVGFAQGPAMEKVAKEFPDTRFTIIDMVVDLPNVQSVIFKEQEGSFLVGILAAMASKTGKVGFVGGMDIPLIRRFACGYEQGVKHANKDAQVFQNMTGTTPSAWNDPGKGAELARSQFARGADVVYDPVGGDAARAALRCLNYEGRIIILGFASGDIPQIPSNYLLVKNISAVGYTFSAYRFEKPEVMRHTLDELCRWYAEGRLKPQISFTFPLAETSAALKTLLARKSTGKVVIKIRDDG